jgi:uncharacterized SAM-binding protein YcdF (DUF218 family)
MYQKHQRLWRTFTRKERWGLSLRGWLAVIAVMILTIVFCSGRIYPFLAVTHRVNANVLVVEGWTHEYAIRAAVQEFRRTSYQGVFATGGPVEGTGGYTNDYNTSASVGAELLKKSGLSDESVQMVPSRVMDRDRTYSSAIALRNWFGKHQMPVHSVNVITENVHARRTRLLFEKALGPEISVGIIAVPSPDYDSKYWWRYSEGVKDVSGETVCYLYARLFFYPPKIGDPPKEPKAMTMSVFNLG